MTKLHLVSPVPNEGARLLAQRILEDFAGNLFAASTAMRLSVSTITRIVEGSVVPGEELAGDVGRATRHAIGRRDWRRRPQGGWFDRAERTAA